MLLHTVCPIVLAWFVPALAGGPLPADQATNVTTVIAVRHAEKADETADPPLSAAGRARAETLAWMLRDARISAAFCTPYRRTRDTLAPVATACGLKLDTATPPEQLAARIVSEHAGQTVIVCGHSNTIPQLVRALGASFEPELLEGFDDLFIVTIAGAGQGRTAVLTHMRYAARGPAD